MPVHNRKKITIDFVESLHRQSFKDFHLVVVDDGSTDGTSDAVRVASKNSTILSGDGSLWWAGSLQLAINWLKDKVIKDSDLILIINDDTQIAEDFLEIGQRLHNTSPKALICAQAYSSETGELLDQGVYINWERYEIRGARSQKEINCLSTRGIFMSFGTLLEAGAFKPHLLPHYYSDYEFSLRAARKGFQLLCPKELKIIMFEKETGVRTLDSFGVWDFIRKSLSKRSTSNPLMAIKFILLTAPSKLKITCIKVVIRSYVGDLFKSIKNDYLSFVAAQKK